MTGLDSVELQMGPILGATSHTFPHCTGGNTLPEAVLGLAMAVITAENRHLKS